MVRPRTAVGNQPKAEPNTKAIPSTPPPPPPPPPPNPFSPDPPGQRYAFPHHPPKTTKCSPPLQNTKLGASDPTYLPKHQQPPGRWGCCRGKKLKGHQRGESFPPHRPGGPILWWDLFRGRPKPIFGGLHPASEPRGRSGFKKRIPGVGKATPPDGVFPQFNNRAHPEEAGKMRRKRSSGKRTSGPLASLRGHP